MSLPFDRAAFLALFADYNAAIWPAQPVAFALGLVALLAMARGGAPGGRLAMAILALFWSWNAIAYHQLFFTRINPAATAFAALFLLQALLFAVAAARPAPPRFRLRSDWRGFAALALTAYALILYHAVGWALGHGLLRGPLLGVAPCPTTIFTLAALLLLDRPAPWLSVAPLIWSAIGSSAAILLGVREDLGLAIAAAVLVARLALDHRRSLDAARREG